MPIYGQTLTNYGGIDYAKKMLENNVSDTTFHHYWSGLFIGIIYKFHMPLFVALSGCVFQLQISNNKYKNIKELVKSKFFRLIIPFIVVTTIYVVPLKLISGYYDGVYHNKIFSDILVGQFFLQGDSHLWYLPSLFCDFILIYFIEKYFNIKIIYKIIILILLHYVGHSLIHIKFIRNPLNYAIWFYMGYLFEYKRKSFNLKIEVKSIYYFCIPILIFISTFFCENIYQTNYIPEITSFLYVISGSLALYVFSYLITIKTNIMSNRLILSIVDDSLGIYLYSDPINYLILFAISSTCGVSILGSEIGSIIIVILRLILTGSIAFFITKILRKTKIKYIY